MDLDELRRYCLSKPGAKESYPFGPSALVMKVGGKLFAIIADEADPLTVSLKCEPDIAIMLRSHFRAVEPGYHLNKKHWNTVTLDGTVPKKEIREWIDDSYDLVVDKLPRTAKDELNSKGGGPNRRSRV